MDMGWWNSISPCLPVVLVFFFESSFLIGTIKIMGVLLYDMSKSLQTTTADLGFMIGIYTAFSFVFAPLIAWIYENCNIRRQLLLFGAVVSSCSFTLLSVCTTNASVSLCLAMIGLGHSIVWIVSIMTLCNLAGTNFNLLLGISTCGYPVGICLFPLLAEGLLVAYDWRGVLMIFSGIMFNLVPFVLAVRIPAERHGTVASLHTEGSETNSSDSVPSEGDLPSGECDFNVTDKQTLQHHNLSCPEVSESVSPYSYKGESKNDTRNASDASDDNEQKELVTNCFSGRDSQDKIKTDPSSQREPPQINSEENINNHDKTKNKIMSWLKHTEFRRNPASIFIILSYAFHEFVYIGWHTFLVPYCLQRGLSVKNTIIITFGAAVGNLCGRIMSGVLTHRLVDPVTLYCFVTILNILALLCNVFIRYFFIMIIAAFCSGASVASKSVLGIMAIKSGVSDRSVSVYVGLLEISGGVGAFLGGTVAGSISDAVSSLDVSFDLFAAVDTVTFILMMFARVISRRDIP
ncbi:monocarboxylate transporter 5-like [Lytechinus variegatus]|uniref:monocarboxylate transporter 5-like n=1 Tax=Lytechinus variegatus TaxID=7654 RepID=UPI001BB10C44|nr:monocarboxylate transporter 5-like [Lytechinus variegatus]